MSRGLQFVRLDAKPAERIMLHHGIKECRRAVIISRRSFLNDASFFDKSSDVFVNIKI